MLNRLLRRTATAMSIAVAVAASASCARRAAPRSHVVLMKDVGFQPAELTVNRGDTIVWKNEDFIPHSATARDASWDSKAINADSSWSFVAETAGRHDYYCVFHPTMRGTIDVR
jgi:plastocyanin